MSPPRGSEAIRAAAGTPELVALPGGRRDDGGAAQNLRLSELDRNDLGNAERLLARHGRELLYVHGLGEHYYTGTHWESAGAADQWRMRAHETSRSILEEVAAMQAQDPPDHLTGSDWVAEQRRHREWSVLSGESRRVGAMIKEAQAYASVPGSVMDADPFVINLANGTMRLEGACETLRPHRAEDRLSKVMPVAFDASATCPGFDRFLARVQPDAEKRAFLQRWFGYCLTGATREQKLVFFFGSGGNGKSVFVDILCRIMGDYASTMAIETLLRDGRTRSGADATPDLADLVGARIARASEPEDGARFAEAAVKAYSGGEPIKARKTFGQPFEYTPQFKITVSGNHMPRIHGMDHGIWRRFLLVPWDQDIPESEQDRTLPVKLWEERAGILNWMLDGCRAWLEGGLRVPDSIRVATDEFRTEGDPLGRFIAECVQREPGHNEEARKVFNAYVRWCNASFERPWSEKAFAKGMAERHIEKAMTRIRLYVDIRLLDIPGDDEVMADGGDDVSYY